MAQGQPGFPTDQVVCPNCAGSNPAGASFCAHCGQAIRAASRFCSNCGTELLPDARFCPACGAASNIEAPAPTDTAASGQPSMPAGLGLPGETEYMGFWIRVAAALIDGVLTGVASVIIDAVTGIPFIGSLLSVVYYVVLTGLRGQTLGKLTLGIIVVNGQGEAPGIGRAALREIVGKFVSAIVILLGYFWIGWDREKRGWHDHIGGTYVVRAPGR